MPECVVSSNSRTHCITSVHSVLSYTTEVNFSSYNFLPFYSEKIIPLALVQTEDVLKVSLCVGYFFSLNNVDCLKIECV